MTSGSYALELVCPQCRGRYRLRELAEGTQWSCLRCRRPVHGTGRLRWLYGGHDAEIGPPSSSGGIGAALDTFSGVDTPPAGADAQEDVIGRYTVRHELGRGGMGVVYLAWDPDLSRPVALKLLLAGDRAARDQVERFLREARTAARLDHAHLVRVFDIGRHEERVYFAMEFVEGPSLHDVIREVGALPPEEAARIVREAALGVHHAHGQGLVHRDLKPANLLLEPNGKVLVADFGLAKELRQGTQGLTATGQVLGTPAFMAPEQARGGAVDARTDVYALGAILYDALSGRAPYGGESAAGVLAQVIEDEPEPLARITQGLPAALVAVCATAMSREPARRYASAEALASDLGRFLAGDPVQALPPSIVRGALRRANRRFPRAVGGALALGSVLVIAALVALVARGFDARKVAAREALAADGLVALAARIEAEPTAAAALVRGYAHTSEYSGTRAAAEAWMLLARTASDEETASQAVASAYVAAVSLDQRAEALDLLAERLIAQGDDRAVAVALNQLAEIDPARAARRLDDRVHAALGAGQFDQALSLAQGRPLAAVIEALSRRWTGRRVSVEAAAADLDADGTTEIVAIEDGGQRMVVVRLAADFPLLRSVESEGHGQQWRTVDVVPWSGGDLLVVWSTDRGGGVGTGHVLRWIAGQPETLARFPSGRIRAVAAADLDRDGVTELYVGSAVERRELIRIDLRSEGATISRPYEAASTLESDINALVPWDADQDGADELVVGVGGWGGYDVRVLRPEGDKLTLATRLRMGAVDGLATLSTSQGPALVATTSTLLPSPSQFPAERPYGLPRGLHELRFDDGAMHIVSSAAPAGQVRTGILRDPIVGDLDADGFDEVLVNSSHHGKTWLVRRAPDGSWSSLMVHGFRARAVVEADGDAARELLAVSNEGLLLVLGVASGDLSAAVAAPFERRVFPGRPAAEPVAAAAWDRTQDLLAMGLLPAAAAILLDLTLTDPDVGQAVRLQAAELLAKTGETDEAASLYEQAADRGDGAARATAVALRLERHEYAAARSRADDPALVAELDRILAQPTRLLELDQALDPRWQAIRPLLVSRAPDGLQLDPQAGIGSVMSMPVSLAGDRVRLRVKGTVLRSEWSAVVGTVLAPDGGAPIGTGLGAFVHATGGGEAFYRATGCVTPGHPRQPGARTSMEAVDVPLAFDVEVDLRVSTGAVSCVVRDGSGREVERRKSETTGFEPGPMSLHLGAWGEDGRDTRMPSSLRLTSIELQGVEPIDGPRPDAAHALVAGLPALALEGFDPVDDAWPRIVALHQLRDPGLNAAIRDALKRPLPDDLPLALRIRPELFDQVRSVDPGRVVALWIEAWEGTRRMHKTDDALLQSLTRDLRSLALPDRPNAPGAALAVSLFAARGGAWASLGRPEVARAELDRAVAATASWTGSPADVVRAVREVRLARARVLALLGEPDAALDDLRAALDGHPNPEVLLDRLTAKPETFDLARRLGADLPP